MGGYGSGRPRKHALVTAFQRVDVREIRRELEGEPAAVILGNGELRQTVRLQWDECHFGGARPWFVCACGRRAAILYLGRADLRCRRCYRLSYPVCSEEPYFRLMRKARRLNLQLGGDGDLVYGTLQRPEGMHRRTFAALRRQYDRTRLRMWERLEVDTAASDERFSRRLRTLAPGLTSPG